MFAWIHPTRVKPEKPIITIGPVGGGKFLLLCFLGFGFF